MRFSVISSSTCSRRDSQDLDDGTPGALTGCMTTLPYASPLIAWLLLTSCGPATSAYSPKGGPRGLRANEHMKVAQQDDALAMQDSSWPGSMVTTNQPAGEPSAIAMPWIRSWTASDVHQRMAADHRSQAEQLNAEFDDACRGKSDADIQVSPLIRFGRGGWTTQSGVIVYLAPSAGTPDNVLATVRCHRAYMMMAPAGMDDCPLDLPGLELDARGDADGITLSISVKNSALIPELQRRAALELEVGKQRAAAPHQAPTESGDESGPK